MSDKEFQIETNFYTNQNTFSFNNQFIEKSQLTAKSASSGVNYRKSEPDASFNSYRYEHVPDNEYSHLVAAQETEDNQPADLPTVHKLQAAYIIIGLIERLYGKAIFTGFADISKSSYQQEIEPEQMLKNPTVHDLKNQEVLKDFSNNLEEQEIVIKTQNTTYRSGQAVQSVQQRKQQILQRQRRGLTLDSLQRQRQSKSKSANKILPQKDISTNIPKVVLEQSRAPSEQKIVQESSRQQQKSQVSRKSYREKYEEYKHRNQSQQKYQRSLKLDLTSLGKSYQQTLPPILTHQNHQGTWDHLKSHNYNTRYHSTNQSIPQNLQQYNYSRYLSSFPQNNYGQYNELFSYKSPVATNINSHRSNYHVVDNAENILIQQENVRELMQRHQEDQQLLAEHQWVRAKLIEEISMKLSFSRLRIQQRTKNDHEDLELIRKIIRLEKMVLTLQEQQSQQINQRKHAQLASSPKDQGQNTLNKFMTEFALIRQQINELKLSKVNQLHQTYQHSRFIDDDSAKIIKEQQILLNNYQRETQRLLRERQHSKLSHHTGHIQTYQAQTVMPGQKMQPKTQKTYKNFTESTVNQNIVYRRVLLDGKHEPYEFEQRELREEQIRQMTQKVRLMRGLGQKSVSVQNTTTNQYTGTYRPIRQKYEQQLQKLKSQRSDLRQQDDSCCVLLKY